MVLYKLTAVELDSVCGGRRRGGESRSSENSVEVDLTVVRVNQRQRTRGKLSMARRAEAGQTQIISIGNIGDID